MSETGASLDPALFVQPGRRLLIDTNIFMDTDPTRSESRKRLFERCQAEILRHKNPIVVPSKVIDELTKQSRLDPSALSEERQAAVKKAANALVFLRSVEPEGLVRSDLGDASNPYADDLFVELFSRTSDTYDLCLLTFDTTLRLRLRLLAATSGRDIVTGTLSADGMIEVEADQALFERGLRKLAKQRQLTLSGLDSAKAEREVANLEPLLAEIQTTLGLRIPPSRTPRTTFASSAGFKGTDRTLSPIDIPAQGATVHYATAAGSGTLAVGAQIGEGGEGRVYEVAGQPDRVVKIFDAEHRTEHRYSKLNRLVAMGLERDGIGFPTSLLTNEAGAFVGYAMPRASGRELQATVMRPKRFTETYPNWTKADLVDVCISFLEKVAYLHSLNILLGDINPKNLLVDASKTVWIIDADSWQLDGYPCPVGTAMFTAPTMKGDYADRLRTNQEELFAVATMLFMVLITGQFPYARAHTDGDVTQLIAEGKFSFQFQGASDQDQPDGNWKYMWSHLPVKVKGLFWHTFHRNGQRYSRRPTAVEWLAVFREYREYFGGPQDFDPMSNDVYPSRFKAFRPDTVIKECPACKRQHAIVGEWDDETQSYTVPERCFQCSRSTRPANPPTPGTCRSCGRQFAKSSLIYGRCPDCTEKANQLDPSRLCADCWQPFITFGNIDWYGKRDLIVPRRHQAIKEACPPRQSGTIRPGATRPARPPTASVATKPARESLLTRIIKTLFS